MTFIMTLSIAYLLVGFVQLQSTIATLSSAAFRETSTTTTIATSRIPFDTLSPAAFRTTTTTTAFISSNNNKECSEEQRKVCQNGGQCVSIVSTAFFYCICNEGFIGIDCSNLTTTTATSERTTTTSETTSTTSEKTTTTTIAFSTSTAIPSTTTSILTTTATSSIISKVPCISAINICRNEGVCFIVNENDLVCECKDNFYGKFCEFDLTPFQNSKILRY